MRLFGLSALTVAVLVSVGCSGMMAPRAGRAPDPLTTTVAAEGVRAEPWMLPADAVPTQRLFRVHYDGPQGDLSFKLSVYLERHDRFRLQASDPLGRKLWSLRVDGASRALWLNHRDDSYCHTDADRGLVFIPLTELPLGAVPRLLLGRLPEPPVAEPLRNATDISYHDPLGREWTAALDAAGAPLRWRLLEDGEAIAWWQRGEAKNEALFSDRRGRQQVRWRQVISEPFTGGMPATEIPPSYAEVRCEASG